jgi:hypothetical protein
MIRVIVPARPQQVPLLRAANPEKSPSALKGMPQMPDPLLVVIGGLVRIATPTQEAGKKCYHSIRKPRKLVQNAYDVGQ